MSVDPKSVAEARAHAERQLSAAELEAYVGAPITDAERAEVLELSRWFTTRYPTACERLAYIRRALTRPVRRVPSDR